VKEGTNTPAISRVLAWCLPLQATNFVWGKHMKSCYKTRNSCVADCTLSRTGSYKPRFYRSVLFHTQSSENPHHLSVTLIIITIINVTVQETRSLGLCKAALHNATAVYTWR